MKSIYNEKAEHTDVSCAIGKDITKALEAIFAKYPEYSPREIAGEISAEAAYRAAAVVAANGKKERKTH